MKKILSFLLLTLFINSPILHADVPKISKTETVDDWKKEEVREKVEESAFTKIFARMIVLLLVTLLLLVAFAWVAKRFLSSRQLSGSRQSRIQIIERRMINQKAAVLLIKVDNEEFLIAESPHSISLLKEMPKEVS